VVYALLFASMVEELRTGHVERLIYKRRLQGVRDGPKWAKKHAKERTVPGEKNERDTPLTFAVKRGKNRKKTIRTLSTPGPSPSKRKKLR